MNKHHKDRPGPRKFQVANGEIGVSLVLEGETKPLAGKVKGPLILNKPWGSEGLFGGGKPETPLEIDAVQVKVREEAVEIMIPKEIMESNPETLCFEWFTGEKVR